MPDLTIPKRGTPEHEWFMRGAEAEADARDDGLNPAQLEVAAVWKGMCRRRNDRGAGAPVAATVADLACIFWAAEPWWSRIRLAWRAIR